jgi:hypothetical protein
MPLACAECNKQWPEGYTGRWRAYDSQIRCSVRVSSPRLDAGTADCFYRGPVPGEGSVVPRGGSRKKGDGQARNWGRAACPSPHDQLDCYARGSSPQGRSRRSTGPLVDLVADSFKSPSHFKGSPPDLCALSGKFEPRWGAQRLSTPLGLRRGAASTSQGRSYGIFQKALQ